MTKVGVGFFLLCCKTLAHGQWDATVLRCEQMIDVGSGEMLRDQQITVQDNKIVAVSEFVPIDEA